MKTLCLITDATSPHTKKWLTGCAGLDWRIVIVSHRPAEIPGVTVYCHPLPLVGFLWHMWGARRLIRRLQPDLIHAHQFGAHGLYAWYAACAPVVITAWGSDILVRPKRSAFIRLLTRFQIRKAALITAVSQELSREIIKLGAKPEQILTFPFGVPRRVYDWLSKAEKKPTPFVICSPRLHEPIYNLQVILEAFLLLHNDFPAVQLWLLGDGSQTRQLQDFVKSRALDNQVRFWGRVSPEDFSVILAQCQIMVSIPSSDGAPVSLLEAMAAGCFPIVSDLAAYHEWITDRQNGFIVKSEAGQVAAAVRQGIGDAVLRQRAMAMNREIIRRRAITEDQFQVILNKYEQLTQDCQ